MRMNYEAEIEAILEKMSLREKIGQLNQVSAPLDPEGKERLKKRIRNGEVGSVILAFSATAGNDKQRDTEVEVYNELQRTALEESRLGIPVIFGRDVIHGHRTVMPIPLASAGSFNPELVENCYDSVALEAANDGVHWTFSPMVDVCHEPRWGRIIEGAGEDPYLASRMSEAIVRGFQGQDYSREGKLAACVKHYLGYGWSEGGRDYFRTEISANTLFNMILPPFRAAVNAGVATVMSSFNDINGEPVTASRYYMTDLLRRYLGFEGFTVSDWAGVGNLRRQGVADSCADCAELALNAGTDMDMVDECYFKSLVSLVEQGRVQESAIDDAVRNILRIKFRKNLFRNPYAPKLPVDRQAHLRKAYDLAAESMVLLKNEDGLLPLEKTKTIALAGPFRNERRALLGSWVLDGHEEETPCFREAMEKAMGDRGQLLHETGDETKDLSEEAFNQCDVIVLALGESHLMTGERNSVADISLSAGQVELARRAHNSGKKVVGVLFCGRPMALQNVEPYLDAILCAWHCGSQTAPVAADILFGDVVPSGKTAVTFVRSSGHIPMYYNTTSSGQPVNGYYGENPERNYLDNSGKPMYPFGFGLSYTEFFYSPIDCAVDTLSLQRLQGGEKFSFCLQVANTGAVPGKETVQLYIRDRVATLMRPIRELKGFRKLTLQPGEGQQVTFHLGYEDLGFYNAAGEYVVEPGDFEIYIGENCLTRNTITVRVVR